MPFSITPKDRSVTVKGTAKLANVKVAVNYGDNLKEFYKEFVGSVSTDKKNVSDTLTFKQNETRAAFIPAGNLSFRLYAKIDGKWKVYKPEAIKCEPNDFITFNVNTSAFTGKLTIGIRSTTALHLSRKSGLSHLRMSLQRHRKSDLEAALAKQVKTRSMRVRKWRTDLSA